MFSNEESTDATSNSYSISQTQIGINPNTYNPDQAWDKLKNKINWKKVEPLQLDTPIFDNKVRFVCVSDTHSKTHKMAHNIPKADVLLHAGDFTSCGGIEEVKKFNAFLGTLDDIVKYKVVIAGNHELSFDENSAMRSAFNKGQFDIQKDVSNVRDLLTNCIYLEDSAISLYGIKIYGAPWQPLFGGWAFNVNRGQELLNKWNKIPEDTDILMTHGPPLGFGDLVSGGYHVGCCELLTTIRERVKPKYHIFGHIHEDHGIWSDGTTTFINASICNLRYSPCNPPIIFDIDLPDGIQKEAFVYPLVAR